MDYIKLPSLLIEKDVVVSIPNISAIVKMFPNKDMNDIITTALDKPILKQLLSTNCLYGELISNINIFNFNRLANFRHTSHQAFNAHSTNNLKRLTEVISSYASHQVSNIRYDNDTLKADINILDTLNGNLLYTNMKDKKGEIGFMVRYILNPEIGLHIITIDACCSYKYDDIITRMEQFYV